MAGGAAMSVATKSGTNNLRGLGVLLPQPGRVQRPPRVLRPDQARREHQHHGRHGRRPDPARTACSTSAAGSGTTSSRAASTHYTVPTAKMRNGDFSEVLAFNPSFRIYDPADGQPDDGRGPHGVPGRGDPGRPHQQHLEGRSRRCTRRPTTPAPTTACRTTSSSPACPMADARQLRRQGELEPHVGAPDLGQVLDDGRHRCPDLF